MTVARPQTTIDLSELERDYIVKREVGRGGMGSVYLGRHRSAGHDVAIKVISGKHISDADALSRFEREARLMVRIRHPNIVHQYELRRLGAGHVALVMQYVRGESLVSILRRRGKLRFDETEQILRDISHGLEHAHANGIVHRDVKPHNILIDADSGRALLSDFGIAKATQGDAEVTATGMAIGTPAYMAPEQIDNGVVDGRADIYGLGIVGWEMLSGKRPWEGESLFGIIYKQKHEHLAPLTLLRPDSPQRLLLALEGALEKRPDHRWNSAHDFIEQLASDTPTVAMIRRREAIAGELGVEKPAQDGAAPSAATLPFHRTGGSASTAPAGGAATSSPVSAPAPPSAARSIAQTVGLVATGAVVGALALYALTRGGSQSATAVAPTPTPAAVAGPSAGVPAQRAAGAPRTATGGSPTANGAATGRSGPDVTESPAAGAPRQAVPPVVPETGAPRVATIDVPAPAPEAAAVPLDVPPDPRVRTMTAAAAALFRVRQLEPASRLIDSVVAITRTEPAAYALRARVSAARGDLRTAWADAEIAERLGDRWGAQTIIAMLEARVGERRAARARLAGLLRSRPAAAPLTVNEGTEIAIAYLAIGETKRALDALERVRDDGTLRTALHDRAFDRIRRDDRFEAIAASADRGR